MKTTGKESTKYQCMMEYLLELLRLLHVTKNVFGEGVKDVQAVNSVVSGDREVERHQGDCVWFRDCERRIEASNKVRQLGESDELGCVWVIPGENHQYYHGNGTM